MSKFLEEWEIYSAEDDDEENDWFCSRDNQTLKRGTTVAYGHNTRFSRLLKFVWNPNLIADFVPRTLLIRKHFF
jgi:hypothetical protein